MKKLLFAALALTLVAAMALPASAQFEDEAGPGALSPVPTNPTFINIAGVDDELFVGSGAFGGGAPNDAFTIDADTDTATAVFTGTPVWGATYNPDSGLVLFTTSGGVTDGADLFSFDPVAGGAPALVGTITLASGADLRIDGLAFSGGTLFGVHQFDDAAATAGLFSIDSGTLVATSVLTLPSGNISGIAADGGVIYGVDDTNTEVVIIDPGSGTSSFAAYPGGEFDIDGLAGGDGTLYLVTDEAGAIYTLDIATQTYGADLTGPFATATTFSAGAYIVAAPDIPSADPSEIPTLSTVGIVGLGLLLAFAAAFILRRRA
ncbi:MAG: hypothetical protein AAGD01_14220 [Acidobacteriota bacterium]